MIPKHKQKGLLSGFGQQKSVDTKNETFQISFQHLDTKQGQTFHDWEEEKILAHALEVLAGYCKTSLIEQMGDKKFSHYGDFPKKSDFVHPLHVPEDAKWARIHIKGKQIVAGHYFRNTFYVVFLDKKHQFYKTDLQDR